MKIKKGTILEIEHRRKGTFTAMAKEDFDIEDEWYLVTVCQAKEIDGMNTTWELGEDIPCRASLCKIKVW